MIAKRASEIAKGLKYASISKEKPIKVKKGKKNPIKDELRSEQGDTEDMEDAEIDEDGDDVGDDDPVDEPLDSVRDPPEN